MLIGFTVGTFILVCLGLFFLLRPKAFNEKDGTLTLHPLHGDDLLLAELRKAISTPPSQEDVERAFDRQRRFRALEDALTAQITFWRQVLKARTDAFSSIELAHAEVKIGRFNHQLNSMRIFDGSVSEEDAMRLKRLQMEMLKFHDEIDTILEKAP